MISAANVSGAPGTYVYVPITLGDHDGVSVLTVAITYNSAVLERLEVTNGGLMLLPHIPAAGVHPISLTFDLLGLMDVTHETGVLATIRFRILDTAAPGTSVIGVTVPVAARMVPFSDDLPHTPINGSVNVNGYQVADFYLDPETVTLINDTPIHVSAEGNASSAITVDALTPVNDDIVVIPNGTGVNVAFIGDMPTAAVPGAIISGPYEITVSRQGIDAVLTIYVNIPAYGTVVTDPNLVSITAPEIRVLRSQADAGNWGLPSTVELVVSPAQAGLVGTVVWGLPTPAFNPANPAAQTLFVTGTVTLPGNVTNTAGVALTVTATLNVDAFGVAPTGVADVTWTATAMIGFAGLSAALWVYVVARRNRQGA
jgi:hypothetical protein